MNSAFVGKEEFCRSQRVLSTLAFSLSGAIISLHSKCFRGVGEQRKTKEQNQNDILPARKGGESQNKREGVGEEKEENACRQTLDFENRQRTELVSD